MKELDVPFYIDDGPVVTINELVRKRSLLRLEIGRKCTGSKIKIDRDGNPQNINKYRNVRFVLVFDDLRLNVDKSVL
jgi:hypothetical protein